MTGEMTQPAQCVAQAGRYQCVLWHRLKWKADSTEAQTCDPSAGKQMQEDARGSLAGIARLENSRFMKDPASAGRRQKEASAGLFALLLSQTWVLAPVSTHKHLQIQLQGAYGPAMASMINCG